VECLRLADDRRDVCANSSGRHLAGRHSSLCPPNAVKLIQSDVVGADRWRAGFVLAADFVAGDLLFWGPRAA